MITIPLTADALSTTRFAVSPLMHAVAVLHPYRSSRKDASPLPGGEVSELLRARHLRLLAAVRRAVAVFTPVFCAPVFLTPPAAAGRTPEPQEDLHRVATAPSELVTWQISSLLAGRWQRNCVDIIALRTLREAAERGEGDFADRLARELHEFWTQHLARTWSSASGHAAEDISVRTRLLADYGIGAVLDSLHEDVGYSDGAVHLAASHNARIPSAPSLVLFPSAFAHKDILNVDGRGGRSVYLTYPTRDMSSDRRGSVTDRPQARGVGPTRFELLADLDVPRTTTELARLHQLSPSTVSYHLTHLRQAGLVARTRVHNAVYYQRGGASGGLTHLPPVD